MVGRQRQWTHILYFAPACDGRLIVGGLRLPFMPDSGKTKSPDDQRTRLDNG
jgi:hypothetical protein